MGNRGYYLEDYYFRFRQYCLYYIEKGKAAMIIKFMCQLGHEVLIYLVKYYFGCSCDGDFGCNYM